VERPFGRHKCLWAWDSRRLRDDCAPKWVRGTLQEFPHCTRESKRRGKTWPRHDSQLKEKQQATDNALLRDWANTHYHALPSRATNSAVMVYVLTGDS
jgi:hypothetical protein